MLSIHVYLTYNVMLYTIFKLPLTVLKTFSYEKPIQPRNKCS